MKILLCGGAKTDNLIIALENRFKSGMSFCKEEFIRNIDNFIMRGESFDRAIVFEQSISRDGYINDIATFRKDVSTFIDKLKENFSKYEIVFVTETRDKARMIIEETIDVAHISIVIVKEPPYVTSFITQLVSTELRNFDKGIKFTQDDVRQMIEEENNEDDILWSDEIEMEKGETLSLDGEKGYDVENQFDNFEFVFTRRGIAVLDAKEEVEKMKFSDEIKSKKLGRKTKELVRKG